MISLLLLLLLLLHGILLPQSVLWVRTSAPLGLEFELGVVVVAEGVLKLDSKRCWLPMVL